MKHLEAHLQQACVAWFAMQHYELSGLLFSSLNGMRCSPTQARTAKAEGMVAGVADLMLAVARHGYHGLFIELKNGSHGRQSKTQEQWQAKVEAQGYRYVIIRDFYSFRRAIEGYLNDSRQLEIKHDGLN